MNKIRALDLATGLHVGILLMTVILFAVVQTLPLLGTLGFESANVFVTLMGPFFFLAASANSQNKFKNFSGMLGRELLWLFIHLGVFSSMLVANGFISKSCSEGSGLLPFMVIAIPPLLLNLSIGLLVAYAAKRIWLKIVIFIAAFGIYYSLTALLWWQEPEFRLLTHASILMSSDLLTGDILSAPVVGFRTSTLMLAFAVICFGTSFLGNNRPAMFKRTQTRPVLSVVTLISLLIFHLVLHVKSLEALGKRPSDLRNDYHLLAEQNGLRVLANPLKTSVKDARRILDEALFYQAQIDTRLGLVTKAPVTIWLHQTSEEKFLYTGAKNVHFALPRHREIHISDTSIPHDVLGHELAHIYVAEHSPTFLGVPSSFGIVPNMALTEGLATALSEELNLTNGMTLLEQAAALYQANIRVDINQLFSNNPIYFASSHPRAAYIYAGATLTFFLTHIKESERPKKLRELIEKSSLVALFGDEYEVALSIAALMKKLNEPMPAHAILWAQKSFPKASILTSDCSEKTHHDSEQLKIALINEDDAPIGSVVDQLPLIDRLPVLSKSREQMLQKGAFLPALNLMRQEETLITNSAELAQLRLSMIDAMVNLNEFDGAVSLLPSIDEKYFFDSHKRLLLALEILFQEYAQAGELSDLSKATISFLFSRSQELPTRLADLSEQLGKASMRETAQSSLVALISTYIQARAYLRSGLYDRARPMIEYLLTHLSLLPDPIERETHNMWGSTLKGVLDRHAALIVFQDLLSTAKTAGERLYLEDQIERLQFAIKR